jgi:hypothetical protein
LISETAQTLSVFDDNYVYPRIAVGAADAMVVVKECLAMQTAIN